LKAWIKKKTSQSGIQIQTLSKFEGESRLKNKDQLLQRYLLVMGLVGIMVILLFGWLASAKKERAQELDSAPLSSPKSSFSSSRDDGKMPKAEQFVKDFLTSYLQYDPQQPLAHVNELKPYLSEEVFQREKEIYGHALPDVKSRRLASVAHWKVNGGDQNSLKCTVLAKVEVESASGVKSIEEVLYTFQLVVKDSKWHVRWFEYVSADDY
jgi:hypothetical protein